MHIYTWNFLSLRIIEKNEMKQNNKQKVYCHINNISIEKYSYQIQEQQLHYHPTYNLQTQKLK